MICETESEPFLGIRHSNLRRFKVNDLKKSENLRIKNLKLFEEVNPLKSEILLIDTELQHIIIDNNIRDLIHFWVKLINQFL